jgi:hypothetical protein
MNLANFFLGCFCFGLLWSLASFLLGGFHLGHHHIGTGHGHHFHSHSGSPQAKLAGNQCRGHAVSQNGNWSQHFLNLHTLAIFLAWMGGCGYLMQRHTTFGLAIVLSLSTLVGLTGGTLLAFLLRFLHGREFAMQPDDYELIGVLGRISSPVRFGGTGEMTFTRDGGRQLDYVRSETDAALEKGQEVVITSFRNGIAYVRTWDALTGATEPMPASQRDQGLGPEDAPLTRG